MRIIGAFLVLLLAFSLGFVTGQQRVGLEDILLSGVSPQLGTSGERQGRHRENIPGPGECGTFNRRYTCSV